MKNRLTSNLLFGLAAASFFAVSAFAQDAAPAAEAPAAAPVAETPAATPAAAPAETQAAPAPAQEAPAAAPAQETPVAAAPAEEKNAESVPAENTNPGEVADAAGNALGMLKASMNEGTSEAQMEVKYNGEVEFDAYTGNVWAEDDLNHSYASTFDLNFEVKFNEKWSAFVGLEADGETTDPAAIYNGAYIQYQPADFFAVKLGDLTFSEGAFVAYYDYDDPADNAAGMKEHDIRGLEIDLAGFILGVGFGRGDNDWADEEGAKVYDVHAAYEFDYAGQHLRPYVDYKSFQTTQHNELHAGVEAGLSLGGFGFRAVYGFHADYLGDDGDCSISRRLPSMPLLTGAMPPKMQATLTTAKFRNTSSCMPNPPSSLQNSSSSVSPWNTTRTPWMMTTKLLQRSMSVAASTSLRSKTWKSLPSAWWMSPCRITKTMTLCVSVLKRCTASNYLA